LGFLTTKTGINSRSDKVVRPPSDNLDRLFDKGIKG